MTSSSHTIPATSPSFTTRLQKRPCSRARAATAPGRLGPGSTFVRSRSKFGRRGSQGSIVDACALERRARRNPYYLAFTAILSCITPSLSVSTALVASTHLRHTGRVTCHRGSPAAGTSPVAPPAGSQLQEAERSSIRTRNGPVLLKTKSPKCSLCRRTAGSFERKRPLEPSYQRRRRSVRAFPFCCRCCHCELSLLWHWTRSRSAWTAHRATAATSRVMLKARDMPAQPPLFQRTVSS